MPDEDSSGPKRRYVLLQIRRLLRLGDVEDPRDSLQDVLCEFIGRGPVPSCIIEVLSDLAVVLGRADLGSQTPSKRRQRGQPHERDIKIAIIDAYDRLEREDPALAAEFVRVVDQVTKRIQRAAKGESKKDRLRRAQRKGTSPASNLQVSGRSPAMPTGEELAAANRAWGKLTDREQEGFYLCEVRGLTSDKTALVMGCTAATVRSLVRNARNKLGQYGTP